MGTTTIATDDALAQDQFLGHPKGLYICFLTEMWERFSFYGMRSLLIFYLTQHFLFDADGMAADIYGSYMAMVYALPVIGGFLADRYLGFRKAVVFGGVLLVLGHLGMAIEGRPAQLLADGSIVRDRVSLQMLFLSLSLIIVGVGFLKPNISSIVGRLYGKDDPRRDSGFTIFYMGINLGAASAAIIVGYLGQSPDWGWSWGFGLAGVGMVGGLATFLYGQKYLHGHANPADPEKLLQPSPIPGLNKEYAIYLGGLFGVLASWQIVQHHHMVLGLLGTTSVALVLGLMWFMLKYCDKIERDRMLVAIVLVFFSVFFWSLFEQAGTSMNLFADQVVDRSVLGITLQASQFQSLDAIFILLLGPLFAIAWVALSKRGLEPSTPVKFGLGIVQVGLSFFVLVLGISTANEAHQVALIWLVLAYLLHTTGELSLSPVGLSMITKLSVQRVVGLMMGAWFLASAGAGFVAAQISKLVHIDATAGKIDDPVQALAGYSDLFYSVAWVGIVVGAFALLVSPLLRKRMHGIH